MNRQQATLPNPFERPQFSLPLPTSCAGCGACCMEQESPPMYAYLLGLLDAGTLDASWQDDDDVHRVIDLPEELKQELREYVVRICDKVKRADSVCIWFDRETRQCKHYELRPSICRDSLDIGDDGCRHWREQYSELLQISPRTEAGQ